MNYVYNIEVNFKDELINFYEWKDSDNITIIKKLPIFFIDKKSYDDVLNMNIKINSEFLDKLTMSNNMCIFASSIDAICVKFDNNAVIDKISRLSLEEECEVLNELQYKNRIKLKYKKLNKSNNYKFITRDEEKIINELKLFLDYQKNDSQVIDYLFYEWFEKFTSKNKYEMLYKAVNTSFTDKHQKLFDIIKTIKS